MRPRLIRLSLVSFGICIGLSSCTGEIEQDCVPQKVRSFEDPTQFISIGTDMLAELRGSKATTIDLTTAEVVGDVAVVPVNPDQLLELSALAHQTTHRCGGFFAHNEIDSALDHVANHNNHASSALNLPTEVRIAAGFTVDNPSPVDLMIAAAAEVNLIATIETLSAFRNRQHNTASGAQASIWLRDTWRDLAPARADVSVVQVAHNATPQQSVMMTITGSTLPDEVVVFGAHLDSIVGNSADPLAPGADDDASGIAVLTEMARVIFDTNFVPERTIVFIGYAAEEIGLRGSAEIAQSFRNDNVNVIAALQFDMTNYNGSATDITLIRDFTDNELTDFLGTLIDSYLPGVSRTDGTCGYACSDHASWTNNGYPSAYPFEASFNASNPQIHTGNDTIAVSGNNAQHALKFTKLGAAAVAEIAKGEIASAPDPGDPGDSGNDDGDDDPDDDDDNDKPICL